MTQVHPLSRSPVPTSRPPADPGTTLPGPPSPGAPPGWEGLGLSWGEGPGSLEEGWAGARRWPCAGVRLLPVVSLGVWVRGKVPFPSRRVGARALKATHGYGRALDPRRSSCSLGGGHQARPTRKGSVPSRSRAPTCGSREFSSPRLGAQCLPSVRPALQQRPGPCCTACPSLGCSLAAPRGRRCPF